jgi:hypothetical protein
MQPYSQVYLRALKFTMASGMLMLGESGYDLPIHGADSCHPLSAATSVLAAVRKGFSTYGVTTVTAVGHSLGGAISLLEAVYLKLNIPGATVKAVVYGQPRVGNPAFANYVDGSGISVTRITNRKDPVPILPGRFLGFAHTSGEVHIDDPSGTWYSCPGQDNTSQYCTIGDTPNVFVANTDNHSGPYGAVASISC